MKEKWRKFHKDWPHYEVSNHGRLRSLDRLVNSKGGSKRLVIGRILKTKPNKYGYVGLNLPNDEHKRRFWLVHRCVAIAFLKNPLNLPQVNHIDGNKQNNFVDNLEWVSALENKRHAMDTGLYTPAGECNGMSKLKKEDVIRIRELFSSGATRAHLSRTFKVSWTNINDIINKKRWKHIE